eukprot:6546138-Prymnesium_polylepis.1
MECHAVRLVRLVRRELLHVVRPGLGRSKFRRVVRSTKAAPRISTEPRPQDIRVAVCGCLVVQRRRAPGIQCGLVLLEALAEQSDVAVAAAAREGVFQRSQGVDRCWAREPSLYGHRTRVGE